jgi:hypothetical protein
MPCILVVLPSLLFQSDVSEAFDNGPRVEERYSSLARELLYFGSRPPYFMDLGNFLFKVSILVGL